MIDWLQRAQFNNIPTPRRPKPETNGGGIPFHSADVLDFAGVHLSSFERYYSHLRMPDKRRYKVEQIQNLLRPAVEKLMKLSMYSPESTDFKRSFGERTLVVIPYFAQKQWRTAESILQNRPLYLNATYYSLLRYFPHFVVAVQNDKDRDFVENSGLKFRGIRQLTINTKGFTKLPVAALQDVTNLIRINHEIIRGIRYIFYCEADMMYTIKEHAMIKMMQSFSVNKNVVLFPHRLMTYLPGHLNEIRKSYSYIEDINHHFNVAGSKRANESKIGNKNIREEVSQSCCSDLLNCSTRSHWRDIYDQKVVVSGLYGLPTVIASSHDPFEGGKFRVCNLTDTKACPGILF